MNTTCPLSTGERHEYRIKSQYVTTSWLGVERRGVRHPTVIQPIRSRRGSRPNSRLALRQSKVCETKAPYQRFDRGVRGDYKTDHVP